MVGRILLLLSLLSAACGAGPPAERSGAATPVLSGPSSQGGTFTLRKVSGRPAVLLFYSGAYCPLCLARLRAAAAYAGGYRDRGASVVAVTLDPAAVARATAHDLELPFPLVSVDAETFRRWGVWPAGQPVPRPGDFVLDAAGAVRWSRLGAHAADRASDVTLQGVLDSLAAAGALAPR